MPSGLSAAERLPEPRHSRCGMKARS
jgi:hypothetical protein